MQKKLLFSSILALILGGVASAQVGINTTTPKATFEVVGDKANAAVPDGVLVPRLSAAQLLAKDNVYTALQDGALVYVTTGIGSTTKTSNVDGPGLYYYNDSISKWVKATGGSSAPAAPALMKIRYQNGATITATDLNNAIIVNVPGTNFNLGDYTNVTEAVEGSTITFIDATGGTGFGVNGAHPNATTSPMAGGGSLSYILKIDSGSKVWYSWHGY